MRTPYKTTISKNKILSNLFCASMIVFYASDGINKYLRITESPLQEISIYIRMIIEIIFVFLLLTNSNAIKKNTIFTITALLTIFFINQLLLQQYESNINYSYNIIILNKYLFLFIAFSLFYSLKSDTPAVRMMTTTMERIIILNNLFILFGFFGDISLFKAYAHFDLIGIEEYKRFGYNGLFFSQNESSIIYIVFLLHCHNKVFYDKKGMFLYTLTLIAMLLTGTKTSYLFFVLYFLSLVFFDPITKKPLFNAIAGLIFTISFLAGAYSLFFSEKSTYLVNSFYKNDFMYFISSGRNELLELHFLPFLNSFLKIIIGGQDVEKQLIELDILDLLLFFGLLGSIIYLRFFIKIFGHLNKKKTFLLIILILVSSFSGHLFTNISATFFLIAHIFYLEQKQNYA